ncbi:MAG: type IV pilin protein [Janthinobacterium lividum]
MSKIPSRPAEAGFTLIELMVTISCIIVLSLIALPSFKSYILQSNLQAAKPYLAEIAAKQRMFKAVNGVYCCSNYDGSNENLIATSLGLSLTDSGDFCYIFVCTSGTLCASGSGSASSFISGNPTGGSAPDFEIWAMLINGTGSVSGPSGATCSPRTGKVSPTGWVAASNSASAGRTGQIVALRYPPPPNGLSTGADAFHTGVTMNWQAGTSMSDALFP